MSTLRNGIYITGGKAGSGGGGSAKTGDYLVYRGYCTGDGTSANPYTFYKDVSHTVLITPNQSSLYLDATPNLEYSTLFRHDGTSYIPVYVSINTIDASTIQSLS